MRKTLLLSIGIILFMNALQAQFYKQATHYPAFTENLSKITADFRNNYYHIQGEQLDSQQDMDTYRSAVSIPGAKHCVIYRFHSSIDTTASWQGVMYEGENYKEALKIYKNTCRQIEKSKVNLYNMTSTGFTGKMDEPDENLRFVSSGFKLKTAENSYASFFAEVEMINTTYDQWEVHLNLHNKKDDAEKW